MEDLSVVDCFDGLQSMMQVLLHVFGDVICAIVSVANGGAQELEILMETLKFFREGVIFLCKLYEFVFLEVEIHTSFRTHFSDDFQSSENILLGARNRTVV